MRKALGVALLLAVGLGVYEPLAAKTNRYSGRLPRFTAVTREDPQVTSVSRWHNVPGTWVEFTTTREGPAVATFCGEVEVLQRGLRLRMRGAGQWTPEYFVIDQDDPWLESRCATWMTNLPAGTHKVKVQWYSDSNSGSVRRRTLKVEHQN